MTRGPDDELLPWWWQRQVDPGSPDVVPGPGSAESSTHRNWLLLGTVGGAERAAIDPKGLVTPWPDGWSLDWWVGADDTWHLPAQASGVRQRLVGAAPVVETVLRVPGGEVVQRAWAVAAGTGVPEGGAVVVELENASPVPVAVAFAVRPFHPLGRALVSSITFDGTTVSVDGRPAMILPKPPSRTAVGSAALDAVVPTIAGDAATAWPEGGARCSAGRASAAFLFPLPHTATVRVLLPLVSLRPAAARRRIDEPAPEPKRAPEWPRVVSGWEAQTRRAPRLEIPEPRLGEAVAAARCALLLHAAGDDVGSWPPQVIGGLDTAEVCLALDDHGFHVESERLLLGFADRQGLDGSFAGESSRIDAPAAWLHAVGTHVRLTGDPTLADALVGPVAKAAHLLRRRLGARRSRRVDGIAGLYPAGAAPSWLTPTRSSTYHDALWARRGLLDAAFLLAVADQPDAAAEPETLAAELTANLVAELAGHAAPGAGPSDDSAFGALATAVALAATSSGPESRPGPLVAALDAVLAHAPELIRGAVWHEPANAGLSPRLTAWMGVARSLADRNDVHEPLAWLLERGDPMWAWPELVHPRSGGGCGGEGHHAASTAAVLRFVRQLAVQEPGGAVAVVPSVRETWLGQQIEAHDVPTSYGRFSFAVRWHGDRPALLWELAPHDDARVVAAVAARGPFVVRAPGLDPTWSSTELRGEALLAVPPSAPPSPPTSSAPSDGPPPDASSSTPGQSDAEALDLRPPSGGESFS
ncbi:MAG TPA: hypothetical protein VIY72_17115 [Acidimicrobiales bacterium]